MPNYEYYSLMRMQSDPMTEAEKAAKRAEGWEEYFPGPGEVSAPLEEVVISGPSIRYIFRREVKD